MSARPSRPPYPEPLRVRCPKCGANPQAVCKRKNGGERTAHHIERWRAIGYDPQEARRRRFMR